MTLAGRELTVIVTAYLLAGIPVGAALLVCRMSQLYRLPAGYLCCW
jgi:hypothetical protein